MNNPYEILGVEKTATQAEISKAYKKLAKKYHPDANKDANASEKFKEVSEAYSIIGDETKRAEYDNPVQNFGGFNFNPFNVFNQQNRQRGVDTNVQVIISFKESVLGCKRNFKIPSKEKCTECDWGIKSFDTCKTCQGTGHITARTQGNWMMSMTCQNCGGQGKINLVPCTCQEGYKQTNEEEIDITIPVGVQSGNILRVNGKGEYSQGTRGNLNIHIAVEQHANVTRLNNDLIYRIWCPIRQMLYGGTINLVFFDSKFEVQIPEKTQSGAKIRLKNQGIQGGDLFLVVNADINSAEDLLKDVKNEKPEVDYSNKS